MGVFEYYLIGINCIGFILCLIDIKIRENNENKNFDIPVRICAFLGGSLGIDLGIIFFGRAAKKDVMMTRLFVNCMLVIQVIIVLYVKGIIGNDSLNLKIWEFFYDKEWLLWYLLGINIVTLIFFAKDKIAAAEQRANNRIRILTLLCLCAIGGTIGGLSGMYLFHHKTKKDYFKIGIPMIMIVHIFILLFLNNI